MRRSRLALLVAALLVVATMGTGAAAAGATGRSRTLPDEGARVVAAIDADLGATLDAAGPGQMVDVIVTLRDQADLESTAVARRGPRLRAVVQTLKRTADEAQARLRGLLDRRVAQGLAADVSPFWVFDGLAVTATPAVVREIASLPEVRGITADTEVRAEEPIVAAAAPEPNLSVVNAPAMWGLGYTGHGIVVAGLDTGVDVGHPDLAARWRGGTNSWFDPNGEHASPADVNGHGTWTMGVAVGGDAGGTSVGMAPDAQWIAAKIFDDRGVATTTGIHQAYQWLLDPDGNPATADAPQVVNNSWSMGSIGCNLEFQLDLQSLRAAGILPVFAAGNFGPDGSTSASPANYPEAFAVGATDVDDLVFAGSSRGPSACGEPSTTYPDLVAPGVDVRSTDIFGLYTQQTGTSMSAPHAAGGLALLLDAFPDLTADAQQQALEAAAVDLGAPGADDDYGHGRLDALASYQWLAARATFTVAAEPPSAATVPGGSVGYEVNVASLDGFADDVTLSLSGLSPLEASWTFSPPVIGGGSGSSALLVTTTAALGPGTYPLTVTGTSGGLSRSAAVTLVVTQPPDFTLSVRPSVGTVARGGATTYSVDVASLAGFTGGVKLSVGGLPPGLTVAFKPKSVVPPGTATMTVKAGRRMALGTYTLTIRGVSGSTVHVATATLIVT